MRAVLTGVVILGIAASGIVLIASSSQEKSRNDTALQPEGRGLRPASDGEGIVERLSRAMMLMEARLRQLERDRATATPPEPARAEVAESQSPEDSDAPPRAADRATAMQVIDDRLATEPRDASWAGETESAMQNVLEDSFPDDALAYEITCATSVCLVETGHPSEAAARLFLSEFPGELTQFEQLHFEKDDSNPEDIRYSFRMVRRGAGEDLSLEARALASNAEEETGTTIQPTEPTRVGD